MRYETDSTIDQVFNITVEGRNSMTTKVPHLAFIPKPYVIHDVYRKETSLVRMNGTVEKIPELCDLMTEKLRDAKNNLEKAYIIEFFKENEKYNDRPTACAVELRSRLDMALKDASIEVTAECFHTSDIFDYNTDGFVNAPFSNYIILRPTTVKEIFISKMDIKPKHIRQVLVDERKMRTN